MTGFNKLFEQFILVLIVALCSGKSTLLNTTIKLNKHTSGVTFTAFVRDVSINLNPPPSSDLYKLGDIKTMLNVISGRFSKIFAYGVRAKPGEYQKNITYYSSYPQVFAAQAAALINQEHDHLRLSLLVGALISASQAGTNVTVKVAFESVMIAHSIYPGTVDGVVFHSQFSLDDPDISSDANIAYMTLSKLQETRHESKRLNLRLGTAQNCEEMSNSFNDTFERLNAYRRQIISISDFIICTHISDENVLLNFRNIFVKINENIEVMGQVNELRAETRQQIVNMKNIWERMNEWGRNHNMTIWMHEAFDNLWKRWNPHTGWWSLESNDFVRNVSGYVEKYLYMEKAVETLVTSQTRVWTYVGVALGLGILAVIVVVPLMIIHKRFNRLQDVLSKEDVHIFLYGTTDKKFLKSFVGDGEEHGDIETDALSKPYDRSFEIPRDHFKIEWHRPLGSGEFGIVLVARLSSAEGQNDSEVALKMARPGCPNSVMKSLLSEIKILLLLGEHPHIVSMKGAYTAEIQKGVIYIATELCEVGSLKSYLKKGDKKIFKTSGYANVSSTNKANSEEAEVAISYEEMTRWSYEIACGMEYLASKQVIHADLAARNVLLTADKTAKITDFGLSRRLYDYTNYVKKQQEPLPWRWMAIESLKKLEFSSQSDIWSYGVTLWEIFSMGDVPYTGLTWTMDFAVLLENGLRLKRPACASSDIFDVMCSCWIKEAYKRPNFSQLKVQITKIAGENSKPTKYE